MMSGDAPRYTKEVSSKKCAIFFWRFYLWLDNSETPPRLKLTNLSTKPIDLELENNILSFISDIYPE